MLLAHRGKLSDTVFFGGDSWEYQSLGVNISMGKGFRYGKIAGLENYKFSLTEKSLRVPFYPLPPVERREGVSTLYDYFVNGRGFSFYRTPGYPLFLAFIYRLLGVHPLAVKIAQIILLSFVAALLPLIGRHYWGGRGGLSGFAAAAFFLRYCSPDPTKIMSEPLIVFSLSVLAIMLIFWEEKASLPRTVILAAAAASSALIKGLNIFLPVIILCYLWQKTDRQRRLFLSFVYFMVTVSLFSSWSLYAGSRVHYPVVLSTHQNTLLLDSNNENTLDSGGWDPSWRKEESGSQKFIYNRPGIRQMPVCAKLAAFLSANFRRIPLSLWNKLVMAFKSRPLYFLVVLTMLFYYLAAALCRNLRCSRDGRIPFFPMAYFINFFLITLIFYGNWRFVLPYMPFFALPGMYFILMFFLKAFSFVRAHLRSFLV